MNNKKTKNNLIEELENQRKLLELQKKYENGIIKEENLSDSEKELLINLYKNQIKTLEANIYDNKNRLRYYRNQILEMEKGV